MSNIFNPMRCCVAQRAGGRGLAARRWTWSRWPKWRSAGACVGSGTMLVLLPKCPMCLAAYIAVWTGAGVAAPVAGHLRFVMAIIFVASLGFLSLGFLLMRRSLVRTKC